MVLWVRCRAPEEMEREVPEGGPVAPAGMERDRLVACRAMPPVAGPGFRENPPDLAATARVAA